MCLLCPGEYTYCWARWCQMEPLLYQERMANRPCSARLAPYQGNVEKVPQNQLIWGRTAVVEPVPLAQPRCFPSHRKRTNRNGCDCLAGFLTFGSAWSGDGRGCRAKAGLRLGSEGTAALLRWRDCGPGGTQTPRGPTTRRTPASRRTSCPTSPPGPWWASSQSVFLEGQARRGI